jgi:hypothetical protein
MKFLKFLFIAGIAVAAYILGAKAGRGRYREIRSGAKKAWNDPKTKKARASAKRLGKRTTKKATKLAHKKLGR